MISSPVCLHNQQIFCQCKNIFANFFEIVSFAFLLISYASRRLFTALARSYALLFLTCLPHSCHCSLLLHFSCFFGAFCFFGGSSEASCIIALWVWVWHRCQYIQIGHGQPWTLAKWKDSQHQSLFILSMVSLWPWPGPTPQPGGPLPWLAKTNYKSNILLKQES